MGFYLGVDLGTTFTAAAVWRDGRVEVCSVGNRAPAIPSVVLVREDASVLTGEAADRRAATEPQRVAREFKRRVGDPTPVIVGGTPYSAEALTAKLLRYVVERVAETEGSLPDAVAVCHPANWGDYKKDLLRQAITLADLDTAAMITEPEAAAIHYASQERVEPGAVVAVYDLGGGTFDAAVLRKAEAGWEILGEPQGVERLGGIDFDEAVFRHVVGVIGDAFYQLDRDGPTSRAAVARLRQDCVDAKEALSADTDVSIPVLLPGIQSEVRLTRIEFEQMVRPPLGDSITALRRALRLANVEPDDVTTVLLVGGSSRIPLVAQLVGSDLGRPVAVDAHPKYGIALGAAMIAAEHSTGGAAVTEEVQEVTESVPPVRLPVAAWDLGDGGGESRGGEEAGGESLVAGSRRKVPLGLIAGGVAAVLLLALVGAIWLNREGDDGLEPVTASGDTSGVVGDGSVPDEDGGNDAEPADDETADAQDPQEPFVEITSVEIDGGFYRVHFDTQGFTPAEPGQSPWHAHFFLSSTYRPENVGENGEPPGDWDVSYDPATFLTKFGPANRGDASEMCAVVADDDVHGVADRTRELDPATRSGNCVRLPEV